MAATTQRRDRLREIRRAAYLDLIQHTQSQREILWRIRDIMQLTDPEQRLAGLKEQFRAAQHGYDTFLRFSRVVAVEGPPQVTARAELLRQALARARKDIKSLAQGNLTAMQDLEVHNREAHEALMSFIEEVRIALDSM